MQGTTADIIKRAMMEVDTWLHEQASKVADDAVMVMQAPAELSVPLIVEAESGVNWDEAH